MNNKENNKKARLKDILQLRSFVRETLLIESSVKYLSFEDGYVVSLWAVNESEWKSVSKK